VISERTSVGLDVHARSVVAAGLDSVTGEVFKQRLVPVHDEVVGWLRSLPGPVAATYEAGPTGFGLYRALTKAGIRCEVAAPSKLSRPSGDRVKTDAKDALLLAQLLQVGQITSVRVPSVSEEAARDLVRAREDVRGDLMRARHRVSKLLLRHGHVYYGGHAWTDKHTIWLNSVHFDQTGTRAAYAADREAVDFALARRARLDEAIAVLPAWRLDVDRVRARSRDRRVGPVHRGQHRRLPRPGAQRALQRRIAPPRWDHQGRQHPRATTPRGGCLAPQARVPRREDPPSPLGPGTSRGSWTRAPGEPAPAPALAHLHRAEEEAHRRDHRDRPRARRLVLVAGHSARLTGTHGPGRGPSRTTAATCGADPRLDCEPPATW
jgi:transposase